MPTQSKPGALLEPPFIPLSMPVVEGNEWQYIKECLDTGWVSSVGTYVTRFEEEFAACIGTKYAIAVVNGTAALHIALLVAGVCPDDEVLVSTLTFISPVNAVRYVGAWPVLMDADPEHWQMDPQKVVDFLEKECTWSGGELRNTATRRRVKAIIPVHILGHPVNMDPILEVARQFDLVVIEDATESLGSCYKKQKVGGLGDIACFSFNGNKIITTGGGGMVVTNNGERGTRARYLATQAKDDAVEYIHEEIGYNYRLTNILSAMGVAQLERLDDYVESKRRIASHYQKHLNEIPGITLPNEADWAFSTFWLYTILIDTEKYGISSRDLMHELGNNKIQTRPFWRPVHRQTPYLGAQSYRVEVADRLYRMGLSLPCSVNITEDELDRVVQKIRKHMSPTCT